MKRSGMSMTEVMIGVLLLALILIPSLNAITSQTKTVTSTRDYAQVAFFAQNLIEQCRSYPFDLIEADHHKDEKMKGKTFEWRLLNDEGTNTLKTNGIEYKVDTSKTRIDGISNAESNSNNENETSLPPIWLFKLVINFKSSNGTEHVFDVSTAIAKRE